MQDLMIDLETLSTDTTTVIISLGAVFFDTDSGRLGPSFIQCLDIQDQIDVGRTISASTLKWWMSQENAAKKVFSEKANPPKEVLKLFSDWVLKEATISKVKPWGNGSSFDISIMESSFKTFGVKTPWLYHNVFDLRTFKRFVGNGAKVEVTGTKHNALDDAIAQAEYVLSHSSAKSTK